MALKLVAEPTSDPVTLAEAKSHLNVDFDDYDDLISGYIRAAQMGIVYNTGHALSPSVWDLVYDAFPTGNTPEGYVQIPIGPLISVDSVNYVAADTEMDTLLASSEYEVDTITRLGGIQPITSGWPAVMTTINAIRVRFTAGYPDTTDSPPESGVPASIKHAVLVLVRDMYDFRSPTVSGLITRRPEVVRYLTDPFQTYWI
jgi:uncharacterized phiE125 gp8 family phage protein